MVASLLVITGPARSGKTRRLRSRYRTELGAGGPSTAIWLAPSWRAAAHVRNQVLGGELEDCWGPGVFTFDKFAQAILDFSSEPIQPLTRIMKRQLVRLLIDRQLSQGRLRHFSPIASTGGLVDLICEQISEWKRLEIWPEELHSACQARGFTAKDEELLEIYETYQQTLRENRLYDQEGRFWSARDCLRRGQRRPFEKLRLLVLDGFSDFTRTQHEIIEHLAAWVAEIIVSLPLESAPCRGDLFSKAFLTLDELRRRHRHMSVEEISRPDKSDWPAMSHLEKWLFVNPRQIRPALAAEGVEILAAAKPRGEIELIGERIKRLLAEGMAKPGEVAVAFRSLLEAGALVDEIFQQLGIPFALEHGPTLDRIPLLRTLNALLELELNDWPFVQLLAVLGNSYFRPDWPEWQAGDSATIVEKTIRNLQIPHGRTELLKHLNADNGNPTAAVLNRLAAAYDQLPAKATLAQWAQAWEKLARQTGLLAHVPTQSVGTRIIDSTSVKNPHPSPLPKGEGTFESGSNQGPFFQYEIIAWQRLLGALRSTDTLACRLHQRAPEMDRREAFLALTEILKSLRTPAADDETGRVCILSAPSIRSLEIPYLFLAGLSEKSFPRAEREDRLYSEAEYLRLIEKGLPLAARDQRMQDEMLLFYEAATRATRRLYLSYPAWDDKAQPLLPSPYLMEVEQAFGDTNIHRTEAADFSPVPCGDEPLSMAAFRIKAMADALSGDVSLLAGLMQSDIKSKTVANLTAGWETIVQRQDREQFGPAEGLLPGKEVQKTLADDFSPQRCFSASELEQYAACPYRFLLENVLKLKPLEDLALEHDFPERGRIVHEVLARFHRRVNETLGRPGSPLQLEPGEFQRLMQTALDESLPSPSSNPVRAALAEVDRRVIARWLAEYRDQYLRYEDSCKKEMKGETPVPEFFEASFGKSKHGQGALSTDEPLKCVSGTDTVLISGRIDRIDTGKIGWQAVFNILDYKSGSFVKITPENVQRGIALQLPLYCLATAKLLLQDRSALPWRAGYWHIKKEGFKVNQALKTYQITPNGLEPLEDWEEIRSKMEETVVRLVRDIRRGCFPVFNTDRHCAGFCSFRTVCRIGQIRALEKRWKPTPT